MDLDDGGVDHGVFHVGIVGHGVEQSLPDTGLRPVAEACEYAVPVAQQGRQITPRAAGSGDPQDRLNKSSVVLAAAAGAPRLPRQSGSIFAHWASVKTNRSIQSLNHNQAPMRILNPNRP